MGDRVGGGLAILLRIVLTTIATLLMQIPLLSAFGGLVLFWVAWKLLRMSCMHAEGQRANPRNFLLWHAIGANTGGQIGSVMATAVMLAVMAGLGIGPLN